MFDCKAARAARGTRRWHRAEGDHRRGALGRGLARGRPGKALGGGRRRGAALHRDGDRALDRVRLGGRRHGRRARARARGGGRRGARAGARPRRAAEPDAHHRGAGAARGEHIEHEFQGRGALPHRLRAQARRRAATGPERDASGLGGRPARRVHALRRRRNAFRPFSRRGAEGAPLHGAGRHARRVGRGHRAGAYRIAPVPLRPGGELRLAARGASRRADLHRLRLGPLALRQNSDFEGGGFGVGRPDRGVGLLLPHVRGHSEEHREGGCPPARHTRDHRRASEQGGTRRPGVEAPDRGGPPLLALARARARGAQLRPLDDAGGQLALAHDRHG